MAYVKKVWKDRLSQFPNRRKLTDVSTGDEQIVDVSRVEGTVGEVGDGFNEENMNDLEDRIENGFDSKVDKAGDIMMGGLSVLGTNSLVYEGQVLANAVVLISNANNTVSITIAGTEVYSGNNTGHHSVYFTNYRGQMKCVPYGMSGGEGYSQAWTIKVYLPTTIADLTVNGDIVDKYGNILSDKANKNDKVDIGVIADVFDDTATYAVGDYVMYNGTLYKCTTAHTGSWAAGDFTATLVSDEFGSGGGIADLSAIAPAFDSSTSYAVGAYVTYEGKLYKCTTAHTGEWDATHFTETSVDSAFMAKDRDYVIAGKKSGTTLGTKATAEGIDTTASGNYAHAEGYKTTASNQQAHAEGNSTTASGSGSHAEGCSTTASTSYAHAEGNYSVASANYAHAEGNGTTASHEASHAEGWGTITGNAYQHVGGKFNVGKSTTALEIGKGTNNARSNAFEVEWDGDTTAAGEITDGGGNVLSDKYDATSLTFPNERFTISASGWSSTQTGGYYTYTLNTGNTKYNTYCPVFMDKTGVNDSTDPTAAENAAYALVDKFDMADGTGVNSFTLYAKTKPTTTFYIKLSGQYMAKNAASSSKALDIETANALTVGSQGWNGTNTVEFNGGAVHSFKRIVGTAKIWGGSGVGSSWSSMVNADGYYYATVNILCGGQTPKFDVIGDRPDVSLIGMSSQGAMPSIDKLPNNAVISGYNLIDYFEVEDDPNGTGSVLNAYAKTKPEYNVYVAVEGISIE